MDYSKFSDETLDALASGKKLDYSKLTDDELAELSGTQVKSGIQETPEQTTPGMAEAAIRGAAQGASFGFADELTAILESTFTPKDYGTSLQESRQAYKASEEEHPGVSLAGNVAGGLLMPLPGGSLISTAKGVKGASGALALAKQGAMAGGLSQLGTTEKSLKDDTSGVLGDVAEGVLLGGTITPVLGAAIPGVAKYLGKKYMTDRVGSDIIDTFKLAREIPEFQSSEFVKKMGVANREATKELLSLIEKDPNKAIQKAWDVAKKNAPDISLDEFNKMIAPHMDNLSPEAVQDVSKAIDRITQTTTKKITTTEPLEIALKSAQERLDKKLVPLYEKEVVKAKNISKNMINKLTKDLNLDETQKLTLKYQLESKMIDNLETQFKNRSASGFSDIQQPGSMPGIKFNYVAPTNDEKVVTQLIQPKEVTEIVRDIKKTKLSGADQDKMVKALEGIYQKFTPAPGSQLGDADVASELLTMAKKTKGQLQSSGEFDDLNKQRRILGDVRAKLKTEMSGQTLDDQLAKEEDIVGQLHNKALRANKDASQESAIRLEQGLEQAKQLQKNPEEFQKFMDEYQKNVRAEHLSRLQHDKSYLATDVESFLATMGRTAEGKGLMAVGEIGAAVGKAERKINGLFNRSPEQIQALGNKLASRNSPFGETLKKIATQPEAKRKAMIFSLMQQPGFREMVQDED